MRGGEAARRVSLLGFCQWLADTPGSIALHESLWGYPLVESVHVLTQCMFLGLAVMFDLRLVGLILREAPVQDVAGRLLPWTIAGFVVMVISGAALFYAIPVRTYNNIFFRIKVAMLILSGINVFVFHSGIYRKAGEWGTDAIPPRKARMAGAFSLMLWAGIVVAGRMIAYNWFDKNA